MHWLAIGILIGIVASPVLMILAVLIAAWCKAAFIEVREIWREAGYGSRLAFYGRTPAATNGCDGYSQVGGLVNRQSIVPSYCLGESLLDPEAAQGGQSYRTTRGEEGSAWNLKTDSWTRSTRNLTPAAGCGAGHGTEVGMECSESKHTPPEHTE